MGLQFNPSSNPEIDRAFSLLSEFALIDYKSKQEMALKEAEMVRRNKIFEALKKGGLGGLFGGEQPAVINENQNMPQAVQPHIIPDQAAMSLVDGGYGDVRGNRIAQLQEPLPSVSRKPNRVSPFIPKESYSIDPMTGNVSINYSQMQNPEYESPAALRTTKNQELANSTRIRQEFINRPEVKDYITIKTQVDSMDALLNKTLNGDINNAVALDQALVTMYNKLTDPQSVVRESEYARTASNLPIINRMQGAIQKIERGGAGLTNEDRKALVVGAKIIANERGKMYQGTLDEYKSLSEEYGIQENLITRGIKEHKDYDISTGGFIQPKKEGYLQTQSGNRFKRVK